MSACVDCRFFDRVHHTLEVGVCRVNPPRGNKFGALAHWPQVTVTDWCGAFQGVRPPRPPVAVANPSAGAVRTMREDTP